MDEDQDLKADNLKEEGTHNEAKNEGNSDKELNAVDNTKRDPPEDAAQPSSAPKKRSKRKKPVINGVKKELNKQLSYYINHERRLQGFTVDSNKTGANSKTTDSENRYPETYSSYNPVSKPEKKRLLQYANDTLLQLDLEEICKFHSLKIQPVRSPSTNSARIHNYSRHVGNILHSVEYKQFHDNLISKDKN